MAALAYLAPPITGAVAFLFSERPRVRFHGLQSVVIGVSWPALLYAASLLSTAVTQTMFVVGLVVWLGSLILAALGRDVRLPVVGRSLARSAGLSESR